MDTQQILEEQGKENMDLVNRMKAYKDPLLEEFDAEQEQKKTQVTSDSDDESGTSSGSEEDSGEDAVDIKFPRDNAQDLLQFISRDITNLQNMEDGQKRKFSLLRLYQIFVLAKIKAPNRLYQELLPEI